MDGHSCTVRDNLPVRRGIHGNTVELFELYTLLKKKKSLLESRFILENLIANFRDIEVLENVSQHKLRGARSHSHSLLSLSS